MKKGSFGNSDHSSLFSFGHDNSATLTVTYEWTQQLLKGLFTERNCCFSSFKGGGCSLKYAFFLGFFCFPSSHTCGVFTLSPSSAQVLVYPGLSQRDGVILLLARPFGFLPTLLSVVGLKTSLPISSAWIRPAPPPRDTASEPRPDASEMSFGLAGVTSPLSCHSFATSKTENKQAWVDLSASSTLISNIPHSLCNRGSCFVFHQAGIYSRGFQTRDFSTPENITETFCQELCFSFTF